MSAPLCKCGHKKSSHYAQSENYDAPLDCEEANCWCDEYTPEDEVELSDSDLEDE